jgi:hypothetical protein
MLFLLKEFTQSRIAKVLPYKVVACVVGDWQQRKVMKQQRNVMKVADDF